VIEYLKRCEIEARRASEGTRTLAGASGFRPFSSSEEPASLAGPPGFQR